MNCIYYTSLVFASKGLADDLFLRAMRRRARARVYWGVLGAEERVWKVVVVWERRFGGGGGRGGGGLAAKGGGWRRR